MKERYKSNLVIAKFMEEDVVEHQKYSLCVYKGDGESRCEISAYYDTSWNWLMPVVEKILKTRLDKDTHQTLRTFGMIDEETGEFMVRFDCHFLHKDKELIKVTYKAVTEYIEHYKKK